MGREHVQVLYILQSPGFCFFCKLGVHGDVEEDHGIATSVESPLGPGPISARVNMEKTYVVMGMDGRRGQSTLMTFLQLQRPTARRAGRKCGRRRI